MFTFRTAKAFEKCEELEVFMVYNMSAQIQFNTSGENLEIVCPN